MVTYDYSSYWKPASRQELYLIKVWEKTALKKRRSDACFTIVLCSFLYFIMAFSVFYKEISVWKIVLMYFILLACTLFLWGFIIYEDESQLWDGKLYTRMVVCIGHTEINTRYRSSFSLDIMGERGDILEEIQVPSIIQQYVSHQDQLLAVTNDPKDLTPLRLVPLKKPVRSPLWNLTKG